jgi:hypothetical protein
MILLLVLIAFAGDRIASKPKLHLSQILVVLLTAYFGFYSARNLPVSSMLLVLIAGPILWTNFVALAEKPRAWRWLRNGVRRVADFSERMSEQEMELHGQLWPVAAVALAFAICLQGGILGSHRLIYARFDDTKVPAAAITFLQREFHGDPGTDPVFSTDFWGGYLIFRMYPERKVVLDDRHDLYGEGRIRQYMTLTEAAPGWQTVLEQWQIRTVLLPAGSTLANLLRELPQNWHVVYEDQVAVVFEKG